MRKRIWWSILVLAVALGLACCSHQEPEDEETGPDSATVLVPSPGSDDDAPVAPVGTEDDEPGEPEDEHYDDVDDGTLTPDAGHHDHTEGDLDQAPDPEEISEARNVAAMFWQQYRQVAWDHPEGVTQWIEATGNYVTDRFHDEAVEQFLDDEGGPAWDEVFFERRNTEVLVVDTYFDPSHPFDTDRIGVVIEHQVVTNTPEQNRTPEDQPSQYRMVILERTSDGWLVDEIVDAS